VIGSELEERWVDADEAAGADRTVQRHRSLKEEMNTNTFLCTATLALAWATTGAFAHGDETHAKARQFDASKVEQTAFGREGDPRKASRVIKVDMADTMRFTPANITVKRGETVRLIPTNKGQVLHEMVLGTPEELRKHAELMKKFPGMEHDEPYMAHVKPGTSGEIVWQFTQPGEFQFACLIPGHFEAGMVGKVTVK
jgi:uncharacterized cupredoxin-like copper-binding protein